MPYSDPKYPVVNPSPDVDNCVRSIRWQDVGFVAATTCATWAYGYVTGKPIRSASASTAAALGLTFAGMIVLQDTRGRLMGYKENKREVTMYGYNPHIQPELAKQKKKLTSDPIQYERFPVATGAASRSVKPKPKFTNYD